MFCPNCLCESPSTLEFCERCGGALEQAVPATLSKATDVSQEVSIRELKPSQGQSPPFAVFAIEMLGVILCGAYVALKVADDWARGHWRSTVGTIVAGAVVVWLLGRSRQVWRVLGDSGQGLANRKRLLVGGIVFAVLFLGTAAILGRSIGQSGKETAEMVKDLEERLRLSRRIGEERIAGGTTIPGLVEMYKRVESDVGAWEVVLGRLQGELESYDERLPEAHEETAQTMRYVALNLRQASLIQQQIEVAKAIEPLDPAAQAAVWQEKMDPLLNEEEALNKAK